MTATGTPRYFAVADPDDPDRMTYWRRNAKGELVPHPSKAKYGPILYARGNHPHVVPSHLRGSVRRLWARRWFETVQWPWRERVEAAIAADPATAALTFGRLTSTCCICGRKLTDPATKVYGIGPECGKGLSGDVLAWLNEQLGRAHAAWVGT